VEHPIKRPEFPIRVIWFEAGEVDSFEDEHDLLGSLEMFDSDNPSNRREARVVDAQDRAVWLRVNIVSGVCDARLLRDH